MEDFKNTVTIESITTSLMLGRPLSRKWGFPDFVLDKKFESTLGILFGKNGFEIYSKMNDEEKKNARAYFETHGEEVSKMYKADVWEDWDDSKLFKFDLQYLFDNHRNVYKKVAENIADRAYSHYHEIIFKTIRDKFLISPKDLTDTIATNISKK